jgi:hypothetical protein
VKYTSSILLSTPVRNALLNALKAHELPACGRALVAGNFDGLCIIISASLAGFLELQMTANIKTS